MGLPESEINKMKILYGEKAPVLTDHTVTSEPIDNILSKEQKALYQLYKAFKADELTRIKPYNRMVFGVVDSILSQNIPYIETGWDVVAFEETAFCKELYKGLRTVAVCNSDTDFIWIFNDEIEPDDEFAISHLEIDVQGIIRQLQMES